MRTASVIRVSVVARCRLEPGVRVYAEEKLVRLERRAPRLHEVRLVLEGDERRQPAFGAELVAHLQHHRLVARVDATSQREAVDRVIEKMDRQIRRRKDRVTEHKGHAAAGTDPAAPGPRSAPIGDH
ncbi:MAG TPA: ribosome-associated translation inhibitor RaiA [Candidatus Dormibacteraeota bacterium]|nr:ribosome-associated translation inhibitor RaiA [Candidatus Dormibacteraeota bacterium]